MLALKLQQNRVRHQHQGATPKTLTRILEDDVNLAVWQRQLPLHIADFAALVLSRNEPIREIAKNVLRQISLNALASA